MWGSSGNYHVNSRCAFQGTDWLLKVGFSILCTARAIEISGRSVHMTIDCRQRRKSMRVLGKNHERQWALVLLCGGLP